MRQFIYILTDNNRRILQVGLTHDLVYTMRNYKELHSLFLDDAKKVSRLVYYEELPSLEAALERFEAVNLFTRSQKEKLIRFNNCNWNDLSIQTNASYGLVDSLEKYARLVSAS